MSTVENSKKKYVTPNGLEVGVTELISLYKEYAKIPIPGKAFLSKKSDANPLVRNLTVYYNSRDVDQSEITTLAKVYRLSLNGEGNFESVEKVADGLDVSSVSMTVVSEDGTKKALLKTKTKDSKEKQSIHIIVNSWKEKSIDVDDLSDSHGLILTKYPFGYMSWSPDGKKLAYIAEHKEPKTEPFSSFVRKEAKKKNKSNENGSSETPPASGPEQIPGQEYAWKEDWGEALDTIVHPVLCILNVETEAVTVADVPDYSLLSPVWIDSDTVCFIGISEKKRRLGLIYCPTRKSVIFKWKIGDEKPEIFYENKDLPDGSYVSSLRNDWSRKRLVFLEREALVAHFGASDLVALNVVDGQSSRKVLVDRHISQSSDPLLQGLYCRDLPDICFTRDNRFIVMPIISFNDTRLISVDTESSEVKLLLDHPSNILDFDGEMIVSSGSDITQRPRLYVTKLFSRNKMAIEEVVTEECLGGKVIKSFDPNPDSEFHSFLISPKNCDKASPCIIVIHGGPHSSFVDNYMSSVAIKVRLGFKVLLINYRGGLGVNEKTLNSLLGKIGTQDVQDCITCIDYYIKSGDIDANNLILEGGSHGGFLITHLSGQHASYNWLACTTRNPVTDVAGMTETTDIPDWCWIEALGYKFSYDRMPTQEELTILYDKSPVKFVDQVKVPTLVLLGSKDRRVPMTQGLKWHRILKARGVKTDCHVYPDKHDLFKVEIDTDVFVHMMLWVLQEYNDRNKLQVEA